MAAPPPPISNGARELPREIHSLNTFWTRFVPPALIGLGWWLSGIELIDASKCEKDWKILGIAFPVFWLAASGSRLVSLRPKVATWITAVLALMGIGCGVLASSITGYFGHVFYAATHAAIIASFGLLTFLAMSRSNEPPLSRTRDQQ